MSHLYLLSENLHYHHESLVPVIRKSALPPWVTCTCYPHICITTMSHLYLLSVNLQSYAKLTDFLECDRQISARHFSLTPDSWLLTPDSWQLPSSLVPVPCSLFPLPWQLTTDKLKRDFCGFWFWAIANSPLLRIFPSSLFPGFKISSVSTPLKYLTA